MLEHILLGCVFSREVWFQVFRKLHLDGIIVVRQENFFVWWLRARKLLPKATRKGFDSLTFLIGWALWKERNARTFGGPSSNSTMEWAAAG
jgi:hypothetical protein